MESICVFGIYSLVLQKKIADRKLKAFFTKEWKLLLCLQMLSFFVILFLFARIQLDSRSRCCSHLFFISCFLIDTNCNVDTVFNTYKCRDSMRALRIKCCECAHLICKKWLIIEVHTLCARFEVNAVNAHNKSEKMGHDSLYLWLYARNTKYILRTRDSMRVIQSI